MTKTRRSERMYSALDKDANLMIRQDLLDYDYLDKLNDKDKMWLNNFTAEYVHADFNHSGKRIHKKKLVTKKIKSTGQKRVFDVGKKDANDRNNARNSDVYAKAKANFILETEDKIKDTDGDMTTEDKIIRLIDEGNQE